MRKITKRTTAVAVFSGLVLAAGIAFAAWTATGTGSGTAKAITATALTTTAEAVTTTDLYPGQTAGTLHIKINNPNPYPVRVTSITANGPVTVFSAGIGTCTVTGVSLNAGLTALTLDVLAGTPGTAAFDVPNAVSMSNASDDGCQGATFEIPVSLSGQSNA
jgi:hypothetical protein